MSSAQELAATVRKAIMDKAVWKPMSETPTENTVTLLTDQSRRIVGVFKGGEWKGERGKALSFEPTHWLAYGQ